MFEPIGTFPSCATAWLAAAQRLITAGGEAYNLVVDIEDPVKHSPADAAVILDVDRFLRGRNAYPVTTVANTIFPQDLYRRHGATGFRIEYLRAYDAIRKKGWGRYFERMVRWPGDNGQMTDQLHDLIEKLGTQLKSRQTFKSVYELTLFDPARDARRNRNRQCLSFLSFKHHPVRGLMLTAMYRNHHYVSRALGNFIGLGNLMAYIAKQVGTPVGPLTCVSTHAEIDTASACAAKDGEDADDTEQGWTITEARDLIASLTAKQPRPASAAGAAR
ncbi:MAG TPA: hypothetical protein VH475_15690 [Tepidisphaeraceae bacterium]|jgi:hypothetical protein